jgi:hypothetical protein
MRIARNGPLRTALYLGLLLALCLALVPTSIEAGLMAETDVRAAVETWVRYVTAEARPDAVVERLEPYQLDGQTVAYVAHLEGGGFCLCGADDLVLPVYFYSPRGTYDARDPNLQYILWEIGTRLQGLQKALTQQDPQAQPDQQALAERSAYWQDLIAGRTPAKMARPEDSPTAPATMTLNLTCKWDQDSPYNDQCPELTPGADEHVLVGCNATATAQIMYYWKWPSTGTGTGSVTYDYRWRSGWDSEPLATDPGIPAGYTGRLQYNATNHTLQMNGYWDNSIYGAAQTIDDSPAYLTALAALWGHMEQATKTPSANFGTATYDWSVIKDTHTDPPGSDDAEAAKFNAHVAIAANTTFGLWSSGSYFGNDVAGLVDHFRYDPDAEFGPTADIYSLTEEIQWLRPAGLGGTNPVPPVGDGGGHAWVVHGYNTATDPDRQFLMNFGWSGTDDGWYTFDDRFPLKHDMMTRIAPLDMVKFVGGVEGDGSPGNPYPNIEEAIADAPNGATLIFKAGSDNLFSGAPLIIDRPFTLKGKDVTIRWGSKAVKSDWSLDGEVDPNPVKGSVETR